MSRRTTATSFHDGSPEDSRYKKAIDRAKKRISDRPQDLEGTPRFDSLPTTPQDPGPPPGVVPKEKLSEGTVAGLQAMAAATEAANAAAEAENAALQEEMAEPEAELSDDEKLRAAIEARVESLDIGQHLMGGELLQTIPIIPGKLEVTFRTVTTFEEVFVDNELADEQDMTGRQFLRRSNEWALAMHVHSLNGIKWPALFKKNDEIDEKAAKRRQVNARKLSTPIFNLLIQNLGWFLERVNQSLTVEALGNG